MVWCLVGVLKASGTSSEQSVSDTAEERAPQLVLDDDDEEDDAYRTTANGVREEKWACHGWSHSFVM